VFTSWLQSLGPGDVRPAERGQDGRVRLRTPGRIVPRRAGLHVPSTCADSVPETGASIAASLTHRALAAHATPCGHVLVEVSEIVDDLVRNTQVEAEAPDISSVLITATGDEGPGVGGCREQRPGLASEGGQVLLHSGPRRRPDHLAELPLAEVHVGAYQPVEDGRPARAGGAQGPSDDHVPGDECGTHDEAIERHVTAILRP
jgi:hypothetical protein